MLPPCIIALSAAVTALETCRPDQAAIAALESVIASNPWSTPGEREAAQTLVLRLGRLRITLADPSAQ
jgi:hypothetical protein